MPDHISDRRWLTLRAYSFLLGIQAPFEEVIVWKQIVLEFTQAYDVRVSHEASRSPLLHVPDLGRFPHVLLVRHNLHDVR